MADASPIFSVVLWTLTLLVIASGVLVVTLSNLFRAALSLGLVLLGVAGLFVLLEAEFLAFVQVLIYVGAILTLVVFAIMLTARIHQSPRPQPRSWAGPALLSTALFVVLATLIRTLAPCLPAPGSEGQAGLMPAPSAVTLPQLGQELVTTLILPFEVIGLVFVAVMVGAIAVAASRAPSASAE